MSGLTESNVSVVVDVGKRWAEESARKNGDADILTEARSHKLGRSPRKGVLDLEREDRVSSALAESSRVATTHVSKVTSTGRDLPSIYTIQQLLEQRLPLRDLIPGLFPPVPRGFDSPLYRLLCRPSGANLKAIQSLVQLGEEC